MSTEMIETPVPSTSAPQSEAPIDLAETFYGSSKDAGVDPSKNGTPPPPPPPPGIPASTEVKAPAEEKATDEPKGTADEKVEKKEESRHAAAATKLGRQVKELESQLDSRDGELKQMQDEIAVLKAKLDGTHQEPPAKTPEQIAARMVFDDREANSRVVAHERYGREVVKKDIYDKGSTYELLIKQKPWVQIEVMHHKAPTVRGMQLLRYETWKDQYGEDPDLWKEKILAEAKPKLLEEFKTSIKETPTGAAPPTVTESRGSGDHKPERSLSDIFYGGGARQKSV